MKYITTDKHPELKEGIKIEPATFDILEDEADEWFMTDTLPRIHIDDISYWIEKDYIKEEEEKEFTRSELIEICYIRFGGDKDIFIKNLIPIIDEWQRQKK